MQKKQSISLVQSTRSFAKDISFSLYQKFVEQYPQYTKEYLMPAPKSPLTNVKISNKQMAKVPIPDLQKSVLCGTCLADSSLRIQPRYKNARIQNRHSTRQSSWFFWKWTVCLKDFIVGPSSIVYQKPDGFQDKSLVQSTRSFAEVFKDQRSLQSFGKLKVASRASEQLTALHSLICENNKEKIERRWLNHMTDYFLMTVWLDDGSLMNKRQGQICLDQSPLDQQKVFVDYLKTVWGIDCYTMNTGERMSNGELRHRICIKDQESLLKLLRIVAPIIPVKEMLYKVMFVPINNTDLLERWASEVSVLVLPEFREYVQQAYAEIRNMRLQKKI